MNSGGAATSLEVEVVKAVRAPVRPAWLRRVLQAASTEPAVQERLRALLGESPGQLTVKVTGDREMRRLNRQFLGKDRPTDVLSFPAALYGEVGSGGYLGDLALSWPAVERQAAEFGHAPEAEAALLLVHGLLHLLGWDHASRAQERKMWELTRACLARVGVEVPTGRLVAKASGRRVEPVEPA